MTFSIPIRYGCTRSAVKDTASKQGKMDDFCQADTHAAWKLGTNFEEQDESS